MGRIVSIIAVAFALFHIYAGGFRPLVAYEQRTVHLTFALVLTFLLHPFRKGEKITWVEICLAAVSAGTGGYLFIEADQITGRMGIPSAFDLIVGGIIILLVLEATRRVIGLAITLIAAVFLLYAHFGYLAPLSIAHQGYAVERIISQMSSQRKGFSVFPGCLRHVCHPLRHICSLSVRVRAFFIDLSMAPAFGRPCKVSVMSSSLWNDLRECSQCHGRRIAHDHVNEEDRFKPHVAGAVRPSRRQADRSCLCHGSGGLCHGRISAPYINICISAALPAILYYIALL
jgi:TRAP-type uncharacterized transport system fused permease subunit